MKTCRSIVGPALLALFMGVLNVVRVAAQTVTDPSRH